MAEIAWAQVIAELVTKRDALTTVVDLLTKHFAIAPERAEESWPLPRQHVDDIVKPAEELCSHAVTRPATEKVPPARERPADSNGSSPQVVARDAAILKALRAGPKTTAALVEMLPQEPGQNDEQRLRACSNALTRLKYKNLVVSQPEMGTWDLVR